MAKKTQETPAAKTAEKTTVAVDARLMAAVRVAASVRRIKSSQLVDEALRHVCMSVPMAKQMLRSNL